MPWLALAPRAWPPPRPRLRLVKAAPNPYLTGYTEAELHKEKADLASVLGNPAAQPHLQTLWQAQLAQVEQALAAKFPAAAPPAPTTPNPYAGLTPSQLAQVQSGLQADIAAPSNKPFVSVLQQQLVQVEQQMQALGLLKPVVPLDSVAPWEKLMDLAQAAAPKMQQALTDAFDWPKLPSGVQQSLVQGQVAQALAQMADFGMQQMESSYVPAFSELAEKLFTDVAAAQWPALREALLQTAIPVELPTKFPDDIMVQRALRYVRTEGLTRAKNLWIPTIEASREIIRVGLAEGKTTPQIARELRQHIGLLPGQGKQLMAYNQGLMESGTPLPKVDALTEKFAAKLLRRRTTVIARTETNAALNVAADTFFEAARSAANLPETALRRFWLITFDSRTCPICRAIPPANEQGHLFNEPFLTSKGPLLRPPAHPQCRCVVIVRPTIIAAPGLAQPPVAPTPPVLPPPVPFPPPLPTPPPKVKQPAKPKKPKAAPVPPPPQMSEQYTIATPSPPWATHPKNKFWEQIPDVDLGPLPTPPPGKLSTGVVMLEDGKVWVYEPKNHFGGYTTAFPKGTVEPHLSHQQNAIKEVFEETGLHAKVTGFLGDFQATTGTTRLYLGHKIGGNPTGFGDETWSVTLMTPADLEKALVTQGHSYPLQALQALKEKGLIPATPAVYVPTPAPTAWPPMAPPVPVVPPAPAPAPPAPAKIPRAKPLSATDKIEVSAAKGEFIQDLGGSTGAQKWRGTDGVERGVKRPQTQQAYEEFLANKLYKELGIDAPNQKLTMQGGKIAGVASDWLEGPTLEKAGLTQDRARSVLKGFVADVWLANRDAVGLTMDNIIVQGNRTVRLDNGGALHFRAQGTLKDAADLGKLTEWEGFTKPGRAYGDVFKKAGYARPEDIPDLIDQVKALQALRDRTNGFSDLVPSAPGISAKQRKDLVTLLQKRARLLEEQVGLRVPTPVVDVAAATAKLKRYLGSEYNSIVRSLGSKGPSSMEEYEKVAINAYTGSHSREMNKPFWSSEDPTWRAQERARTAPITDAAIAGLPKLQAGAQATFYRGVRTLTADYVARMQRVGDIVELEGFASTSIKREVAVQAFHGDKHLFVIRGRGGNYDVRPISQFGDSEGEFLYPPAARFRVDAPMSIDPDTGARVFYLEEVPDVNKRQSLRKAEARVQVFAEPEPWPAEWDTWTVEQKHAWGNQQVREALAYVPTPEERAIFEHFMDKQDSAHLAPEKPTS